MAENNVLIIVVIFAVIILAAIIAYRRRIGLVTAKLCVLAIYDQCQRPSDVRSCTG